MITTARDLRFHAKEILETTMRGEEVIVTYRGKPTAKIIPFTGKGKSSRREITHHLFGMWKDNSDVADVKAYLRNKRKGRSF